MSKYSDLAKKIFEEAGGEDNIAVVNHCATRLRLTLNEPSKEVEEAIKKIVPRGTDYVIDTSGHGPMIQTAINSAKYNGTILALGASGVIDSFNVGNDILMNMRTLKGACEGESIAQVYIPELVRMYKEGKFPLDKLVSVYDFEDIEQAFQDSHAGKIMKPVLKIGEL